MSAITTALFSSSGREQLTRAHDPLSNGRFTHTETHSSADFTLLTAEGDKVTLSAATLLQASYTRYDARGTLLGQHAQVHEESLAFTSAQHSAITVEGNLSQQEIEDIQHIVQKVAELAHEVFTGTLTEPLDEALGFEDFATLQSFNATLEYSQRLSLAESYPRLGQDTTALPQDLAFLPPDAPATPSDALAVVPSVTRQLFEAARLTLGAEQAALGHDQRRGVLSTTQQFLEIIAHSPSEASQPVHNSAAAGEAAAGEEDHAPSQAAEALQPEVQPTSPLTSQASPQPTAAASIEATPPPLQNEGLRGTRQHHRHAGVFGHPRQLLHAIRQAVQAQHNDATTASSRTEGIFSSLADILSARVAEAASPRQQGLSSLAEQFLQRLRDFDHTATPPAVPSPASTPAPEAQSTSQTTPLLA